MTGRPLSLRSQPTFRRWGRSLSRPSSVVLTLSSAWQSPRADLVQTQDRVTRSQSRNNLCLPSSYSDHSCQGSSAWPCWGSALLATSCWSRAPAIWECRSSQSHWCAGTTSCLRKLDVRTSDYNSPTLAGGSSEMWEVSDHEQWWCGTYLLLSQELVELLLGLAPSI